MENTNFLRMKVKLDERTMREVATLAGVSYPTISRIISPNFSPIDNRLYDSLAKVAAVYGCKPQISIDFVPIDNGQDNDA